MQPASSQAQALESGGMDGNTVGEVAGPRRGASPPPERCSSGGIHGAIQPADVRPGDPISAQVRVPGAAGRQVPSRVWRISPLGVELVRAGELPRLPLGTPLDLTLRLGHCRSEHRALPLVATGSEHGRELLALGWGTARGAGRSRTVRAARWRCEPEYAPTGIAPSAVRFEDVVYFRVVDVSADGMQLETSLRNKLLVPGLRLQATCTFPTQRQVRLELRVIHARVVQRRGKPLLAVGATWSPRSAGCREVIGRYLLQFAPGATVEELQAHGFPLRSASRAIDFASLRTDEEYGEVLRLRRLAYVHARKASEDAKDADMADPVDARSRILVARHRGRVVATARLTFPESEADRLGHEDLLALPAGLPPRAETVEVFRTCTHPAYRGSDLFHALLQRVALAILQSGRRYALMSATDGLAPVYRRFGFRHAGASYQHPAMRMRHHLMVLDVARVIEGVGISPLHWNLMRCWELWRFGELCGVVATDPWTRARVRLLRLLRPAAHLVRVLYQRRLRRRTP